MSSYVDRLETLLMEEATGSLSEAESQELNALLRTHPDADRFAFERAAAMVFLAAGCSKARRMPEALYDRILKAGEDLVESD